MKQSTKVTLGIMAVCVVLAELPWLWSVTRRAPAPVPYQYATFRWPAGTETATYAFARLDAGSNVVSVLNDERLGAILAGAHENQGYDYFNTVGDTVILRRVRPAGPPGHWADGQILNVTDQSTPPPQDSPITRMVHTLDAISKSSDEQYQIVLALATNGFNMQAEIDRLQAQVTNQPASGRR